MVRAVVASGRLAKIKEGAVGRVGKAVAGFEWCRRRKAAESLRSLRKDQIPRKTPILPTSCCSL